MWKHICEEIYRWLNFSLVIVSLVFCFSLFLYVFELIFFQGDRTGGGSAESGPEEARIRAWVLWLTGKHCQLKLKLTAELRLNSQLRLNLTAGQNSGFNSQQISNFNSQLNSGLNQSFNSQQNSSSNSQLRLKLTAEFKLKLTAELWSPWLKLTT